MDILRVENAHYLIVMGVFYAVNIVIIILLSDAIIVKQLLKMTLQPVCRL